MSAPDRLPVYQTLSQTEKDRYRAEIVANCELVADCWIYLGALNSDGYGVKRIGNRVHSVSRFMLAYSTRESMNIRADACHDPKQCPYKACCNPKHLFWATHSQNCRQREQAKREERELFVWWETHAWIDGVFYTDRRDPSIEHCLGSLNRGKIERKKQPSTDLETETVRACSVSAFVPIVADTNLGETA
jgi:hypothetical protein